MQARQRGAAAFVLLSALAGGTRCGGDVPPPGSVPPPKEAPREVRVARALAASGEADGFPSSLYVERDVNVAARRSGLIEKVLVDRGQRVRAGQELAVLESDLAERELDMARDEFRLSEAEYDRVRALHESKIASVQEYQRTEISRDVARSRVEVAKAMLERCRVRAPFDGIVAERWAVPGRRVQEDDNTPLFRVIGDEPLRARADVPEREARALGPKGAAWILPEGSVSASPARIVFIAPAADAASGTVPVVVQSEARGGALRPGGSVRVRFEGTGAPVSAAVEIPRSALGPGAVRDGSETTVLVVADRKISPRRVRVVALRGDLAWIEGDVRPAEAVVVGPRDELPEGTAVEPREGGS